MKLFSTWFFAMLLCVTAVPVFAQQKVCINGICYDVVQPIAAPAQPMAMASVDGVVLKSDSVKFKRALLAAAKKARAAGDISMGEHLAIIFASQRPAKLEEFKNAAHELAVNDGLATAQAIDWDKLIAFIEKLIPIIIQLIGVFK